MPLGKLDHVTIHCADLGRSRHFYARVLGLTEGDRPAFGFPGAWLYLDGRAVVHLVAERNDGTVSGSGSLDHVAFDATDLGGMRSHLKGSDIAFTEQGVPGGQLHQIFLNDPDGVKIEINFRT